MNVGVRFQDKSTGHKGYWCFSSDKYLRITATLKREGRARAIRLVLDYGKGRINDNMAWEIVRKIEHPKPVKKR